VVDGALVGTFVGSRWGLPDLFDAQKHRSIAIGSAQYLTVSHNGIAMDVGESLFCRTI
jgi:hypothetical protein